jgi:hypothetical protein
MMMISLCLSPLLSSSLLIPLSIPLSLLSLNSLSVCL